MTPPPPCARLGRQCFALAVTLRVAELDGGPASSDAEATWLLGHTERISFGRLVHRRNHLYTRATLHVPCRLLEHQGGGWFRCRAHGFVGQPKPPRHRPRRRQLGGERFELVHRGAPLVGPLERAPAPRRSLPVHQAPNPCTTARCRTANHAIGAACCRDLQLEVICRRANRRLEALIRNRQSPLLCKVDRESSDSLGIEMISACSYLAADRRSCVLHDRIRPDGKPAKPDLCFEWPGPDSTWHPGCVLVGEPKPAIHR